MKEPEFLDKFFDDGQVKGGVEGDGFSLDGWRSSRFRSHSRKGK
jgi:hypothetical protein